MTALGQDGGDPAGLPGVATNLSNQLAISDVNDFGRSRSLGTWHVSSAERMNLTVTQMYYMSFIKHETRLVRLHSSSKISGRFSPILYLVHGTGRHYVICSDPADTEGPFPRTTCCASPAR